jgi:predicted HNH restriction endonuclease
LVRPLPNSEFNLPILEEYRGGPTYYGIFGKTNKTAPAFRRDFSARALGFFEDVAQTLPGASDDDEKRDIYPQVENRQRVASHLRRERSKLLATECKIRDGYECQACGFRFEETYGDLGRDFAEAHHLVALASLRPAVKTRLEDLITVCANCHRILHRMEGKRNDFKRLKLLVHRHRNRQGVSQQGRK